nr:MAG TPA: hypothetical protein [Caudoviricetes sp.]
MFHKSYTLSCKCPTRFNFLYISSEAFEITY